MEVLQQSHSVDLGLMLSRAALLGLGAIGGLLCIYLGWKLYRDGLLSRTSGEAQSGRFKFKVASAGPGVFFALFGMWLLMTVVNRPLVMEDREAGLPNAAAAAAAAASGASAVAASNEPPCLIRQRQRTLFSGGEQLQPDAVASALELAITSVRADAARPGTASAPARKDEAERRASALEVLLELKESVAR